MCSQCSKAMQWEQKGKVPCNQENISFIYIPKSGVLVVVVVVKVVVINVVVVVVVLGLVEVVVVVEVVVINVVVVVVVVVVLGLVEVVVFVEVVVINVVVVPLLVVVDLDVGSGFVVILSIAVTVDVSGALLTTITDVTMI